MQSDFEKILTPAKRACYFMASGLSNRNLEGFNATVDKIAFVVIFLGTHPLQRSSVVDWHGRRVECSYLKICNVAGRGSLHITQRVLDGGLYI